MNTNTHATLADLVLEDARRARVLESLSLDYCCHGHRPLDEAVAEAGLDLAEVRAALDLPGEAPVAPTAAPGDATALAHDVVDTHHAWMWEEMPRLLALTEKVAGVHGDNHPELAEVHATYAKAVSELEPHMTTEERVVFPAISRMERGQAPTTDVGVRLRQLRDEHQAVGDLFAHLRTLTDDWTPPADACGSYRGMLDGLAAMERDLHEHIHKENNVLFPRAAELEASFVAASR